MKNDDLPHSKGGSMGMWWKMMICPIRKRGRMGMWWKMMICPILKEEECDEKWWFAPFQKRKYGNVMKNDDLSHSKKGEEVGERDEKWWFAPFKKGRGSMGMWWTMMICPIQKREKK